MMATISVVGGSVCSDQEKRWAEAVGGEIARRGHLLLCGGRGGVMEAACRGALKADGLTIGVLPGVDRDGANSYLSVALPTGLGEGRNLVVARGGQALIAIGGGFGTLSEIAFALKGGLPVIALGSWRAIDGGGAEAPIRRAGSAEEAVDWACAQLEETKRA